MKITIENDRARTNEKAPPSIIPYLRRFEGGARLLKTGQISFAASQHNLSYFMSFCPDTEIIENDVSLFAGYEAPKEARPKFAYLRQPLDHQEKAFAKLKQANNFALFYDPGAGKSHSLTTIATYKWCNGDIDAMIVVTPNALVSNQWSRVGEEEPGQLERDIPSSIPWNAWQWGKTKKALKAYEALKAFEGLQVLVLNIDAMKTPKGKKLLSEFIKFHKGRILFAIDESHLIKTRSSGRHKVAIELGGICSHRAILTGTPIGKNLLDLWTQFLFLDERIIGIRYKTAFLSSYCVTRWNGFGHEIVDHKNVEKLYSKIDPYTYRITQEELGLEKMFDEFEFIMYPEQKKHYDEIKQKFLTELSDGEILEVTNAISAMTRMQQISNGYLYKEDGSFQELSNARLDAFQSWLETISDEKIVVWCRFTNDVTLLCKSLGITALDISGNGSAKQKIVNKDLFISDKSYRFAIGTPDAAGTGVDGMQDVCNRAIRYSVSYNYINHVQSENRTSRLGGTGTAFYTDLIGRGTLDRRILSNLRGKKDLSKLTLDDIRQLVEGW